MILVTGASGLLGSNFVRAARNSNRSVMGTYYRHPFQLHGIELIQADLTNRAEVRKLFECYRPDWVVHCAALTNVDWCERHPDETRFVNVEMPRFLAAESKKSDAPFVYISTDSVFDGNRGNYSEENSPAPVNVYGKTKLAGETSVLHEYEHSLVVRTNIYGWNIQEKESLSEWILNRLESGRHVPGFYDVVFTPILVNDLSEIVLKMMDRKLSGLYHVAGAQALSKHEFALEIAEIFGLEKNLVQRGSIADAKLNAWRPKNTSLNTSKIRMVLGTELPNVKQGLERFRALRKSEYMKTVLKNMKEGIENA